MDLFGINAQRQKRIQIQSAHFNILNSFSLQ